MVDLKINFDKEFYKPGDIISGEVVAKSDKYESFEAVRVEFNCTMKSEATRGSGDSRRTYIDTEFIIQEKQYIADKPQLQAGLNKFPFTIRIPIDAPGTYDGSNGEIIYEIIAVLEKENWLDPAVIEKIQVAWLVPRQNIESRTIRRVKADKEISKLEVSVDSNHLVLGQDFSFKIKVASEQDMRGIRAKIAYKEQVAPDSMNESSRDVLTMIEYDKSEVMTDSWMNIRLPTSSEWPFPFLSKLIWTHYVLEVDIDVPYHSDITVRIPLVVTFPFQRESSVTDDTVVFEWDNQ